MKSVFLIVIAIILFQLTACKTPAVPTSNSVDNSRTSLDWQGTYTGILPCADCNGIKIVLTLRNDLTYTLLVQYQGKEEAWRSTTGSFTWNSEGNKITLDQGTNQTQSQRYAVGENRLTHLDQKGNPITGDLSDKYVLKKELPTITERYWKLTELYSKKVTTRPDAPKEAYMILHTNESRVNGNGGCNGFFGTYALQEGNRITFSGIGSTMMACEDMETETQFFKVLGTTDNYYLDADTLILNKAKMAPLARFEAVYFN